MLDAKKVIAYEIDENLCQILKNKFFDEIQNNKLSIINQNFLQADLSHFQNNYKLTGNIPYSITGKILRKILTIENHPSLLVFTLQKEVGEKILSIPHTNFLSCFVNIFGKVKKVINVKRKYFYPQPKVDSIVIKINFYSKPLIAQTEDFAKFLKIIFKNPKKKLRNKNINLKLSPEILEKRVFELSFEEIVEIFNKLNSNSIVTQ